MIPKEEVAGTHMDRISSFRTALLHFHQEYGDDVELVIYKSNISHAVGRKNQLEPCLIPDTSRRILILLIRVGFSFSGL